MAVLHEKLGKQTGWWRGSPLRCSHDFAVLCCCAVVLLTNTLQVCEGCAERAQQHGERRQLWDRRDDERPYVGLAPPKH